ncbi:MAG: hypothetical protein J6W52_04810 [Bacteroidaceae bacterium]|nr:hypothetical protein [Bacteroidaceae bacterium]
MKQLLFFLSTIAVVCLSSCKSREISTAAFHSYTTECLGKSMDGTQTLRVWASGRNRSDAIEQAKKKAVYDVVFTGIQAGSGECNSYPVVDEANARKKYEQYFDMFFANGGAYTKYVSAKNQKKSAIQRYKGDGTQTFGIIVVVNRSALTQRFVSDNIIVK